MEGGNGRHLALAPNYGARESIVRVDEVEALTRHENRARRGRL